MFELEPVLDLEKLKQVRKNFSDICDSLLLANPSYANLLLLDMSSMFHILYLKSVNGDYGSEKEKPKDIQ